MGAVTLLARLHRDGYRVVADPFDPTRLLVGPRARLTEDLTMLIVVHKAALLGIVSSKPTRAELDLLAAALTTFEITETKVVPSGPRAVGAYARCPKHPAMGTFLRYADVPACRKCELGIPPALDPDPPRLSTWFVRWCQTRGAAPALPSKTFRAPMPEQVWAALANGPKSARQVALELELPLADILAELGDRAVIEDDGILRMSAFPERDQHLRDRDRDVDD
jgi:hypothetical protein